MKRTAVAAAGATSVVITAITMWPSPIQLWPNATILAGTFIAGLVGGLIDPRAPGREYLVVGAICGVLSTIVAMILLGVLNGNPLDPRFFTSYVLSVVIGAGLYVGAAYLVSRVNRGER